jgi:hypothetical protein
LGLFAVVVDLGGPDFHVGADLVAYERERPHGVVIIVEN